jgi:hypothetical protein
LDPNQIGAQIWAEPRGNLDTHTNNVDGTKDHGLIQIGTERWQDVAAGLDAKDRAKIKEATRKNAEELDVVKNPLHNIIAGSFHTRNAIAHKGSDLRAGLRYYNSGTETGAGSNRICR